MISYIKKKKPDIRLLFFFAAMPQVYFKKVKRGIKRYVIRL